MELKSKFDIGEKVYTTFGSNPEYSSVQLITITGVRIDKNSIVKYDYEEASGFREKEGIPEYEIIGNHISSVEDYIENYFSERIKELEEKKEKIISDAHKLEEWRKEQ